MITEITKEVALRLTKAYEEKERAERALWNVSALLGKDNTLYGELDSQLNPFIIFLDEYIKEITDYIFNFLPKKFKDFCKDKLVEGDIYATDVSGNASMSNAISYKIITKDNNIPMYFKFKVDFETMRVYDDNWGLKFSERGDDAVFTEADEMLEYIKTTLGRILPENDKWLRGRDKKK